VIVLVTGANGFLGRNVVAELISRGHHVRAMVRPAADLSRFSWNEHVEVFRADLRNHDELERAFAGVDVLVHLAASVTGGEEAQLSDTVVGTTRLLNAMAKSSTRRLVLASSFSVYSFKRAHGMLDEQTPLEGRLYERDGYAVAKTWQERVVRQASAEHNFELTVLRPGFIWGPGNDYLACLGQSFGLIHLVFGPLTRIPLTHVRNCADCFAAAVENPKAVGQTLNVVDDDSVRAWKYMGLYLRGTRKRGIRVPIPYIVCLLLTHIAHRTSKFIFHGKGKLPSLLVPIRFQARFKPLRYSNKRVREVLGWIPRLSLRECIGLTWPPKRSGTNEPASATPIETESAIPVS
jgi:nucleoside-diphosphate-sugar epimerase